MKRISDAKISISNDALLLRAALGIWILSLVIPAGTAVAQITVGCSVDPALAAQYEAVHGVVRLQNNTGQMLELFTTNATCEVRFEVRDRDDMVLAGTSDLFISNPVQLPPSGTLVVTNNLLNLCDLRKVGSYKVYGRAVWNGKVFTSERAFLDIVPGMELKRIDVGLPGGGNRTYTLRMLNRDRFDRLLLRIDDDAAGICYGVIDLGRWVHTDEPSLQADAAGNVHVLYQSGPVQYVHREFAANGDVVETKSYSQSGSSVRLESTPSGEIKVAGATPPAAEHESKEPGP